MGVRTVSIVAALAGLLRLSGAEARPPAVPLADAIQSLARDLTPWAAQQASKPRVVVIPPLGQEKLAEYLRDRLEPALLATQRVALVERGQIDRLLAELRMEAPLSSDETAKFVGNRLGADVIVLGQLTDVGDSYDVLLRAIAVSEQVVHAIAQARVSKEDPDVRHVLGLELDYESGRWRRKAGWVGIATSVALGGLGAFLVLRSHSEHDRANHATSPAAVTDANNGADLASHAALGCLVGAGVFGGASIYLLVTGESAAAAEPRTTTSIGLGVAWRLR